MPSFDFLNKIMFGINKPNKPVYYETLLLSPVKALILML
jgi:hypothetical protein